MKSWTKVERISFWIYLFWISIGLVTTPLQWSESQLMDWEIFRQGRYSSFREFFGFCLRNGNLIQMFLAALNVYLMMIRHWGLSSARRWSFMVMMVSGAVEVLGVRTGFPFGDYDYTEAMGMRIFGVLPLSIPLAWLVVVSCSLIGVKCYFPEWNKIQSAVAVGVLSTGFDYLMEPFATRAMGYWLWQTSTGLPPWQNYCAWFGLSFFLVWRYGVMRLEDSCSDLRPPVILGSMLFLFAAVRIAHVV